MRNFIRSSRQPAAELSVTSVNGGPATVNISGLRLAKVTGVSVVAASALSQEYGSGINLVAPNSVGVYPGIEYMVPVAMAVTGLLLIPKVALFARFSQAMPRAGSFHTWIGRTLSLPVAFVVSFLWWVGLAGGIGVLGYAFATFLAQAFVVGGWAGAAWLSGTVGHLVLGLAAIWFFVLVNALGIRSYGRWVRALVVLVVAVAGVVIWYGFNTSSTRFLALAASHSHVSLVPPAHPAAPTLGAFFSVAGVFVFAYAGLTSAPALGGEAKQAERTIPRGLVLAWAAALVLFSAVAAAVFSVAPWWAVSDLVMHNQSPLATVPGLIGLVAPHAVALGVDLATAVIVAKTINPALMAMSRTLFGWGEDHLVPEAFVRTSATKVPLLALVVSGLLGSAFLAETVVEGFTLGVVVRSLSILVVLSAVAAGLLNVRFVQPSRFAGQAWAEAVARGRGIVAAAVLAIIISAVFVANTLTITGKSFYLQPWFESMVAVALGVLLCWSAILRARRTGLNLKVIQAELPPE